MTELSCGLAPDVWASRVGKTVGIEKPNQEPNQPNKCKWSELIPKQRSQAHHTNNFI